MSPATEPFVTPTLAPDSGALALATSVADLALLIDDSDQVLEVNLGCDALPADLAAAWVGRPWLETVSPDSRVRARSLIDEARTSGRGGWIQLAHPGRGGGEVPIEYRAVRLDGRGRVLAVGRELQAVVSLQEQLVDAQQAIERDYWRYRQMETRYRLLFQTVSDGVLMVDASMRRVVEANPAALGLLGAEGPSPVGRPFPEGFDEAGTASIEGLLATVAGSGRTDSVSARRAADGVELNVSISVLRQEDATLFAVRMRPRCAGTPGPGPDPRDDRMLRALAAAPDAIVVTDGEGRILGANRAFLDQIEVANERQLQGQSLDRWLGRGPIDLNVLLVGLRQHGSLRLFRTSLKGLYGTPVEVEICAASVSDGDSPAMAFFIRDVARRLGGQAGSGSAMPLWVNELSERVGHAPLKDLVRESTDLIERLCIEAALKLTGGNRASAAELLGLSRQSLYVKLGRYGIGGDPGESDG